MNTKKMYTPPLIDKDKDRESKGYSTKKHRAVVLDRELTPEDRLKEKECYTKIARPPVFYKGMSKGDPDLYVKEFRTRLNLHAKQHKVVFYFVGP